MNESELLFDTWAWWEYLHRTPTGVSLRHRFVESGRHRLHTSAISLGELAARLDLEEHADRVDAACGAIRRMSRIWEVTPDIAEEGGRSRRRLRQSSPSASLADGIILATARRAGARIVSGDSAFDGVPGTIRR